MLTSSSPASASGTIRPAAVAGTDSRSPRSSRVSVTSRCWMPSWRLRSIWRRVSSAVATIRAREAASCARLEALLIAVVAYVVMLAVNIHPALFVAFLVFLSAFVPIVGEAIAAVRGVPASEIEEATWANTAAAFQLS